MKRSCTFIAALATVFLVAGCSSNSGSSTATNTTGPAESGTSGKPTVALVMKSLANEFFQTMQKGAEADQKSRADQKLAADPASNPQQYDLISNGIKDEQDVSKQQEIVADMVSQKVSAIVIAPADSKALIPACDKALQAGIPVVNIDNKFDADVLKERNLTIPFVGPDNRKGAKLAGDYLAKKLKSGDPVAIIEGAPNAFNATQRKLGFEDAMKEGGMKIVDSQTGNWETAEANKVASAMITAHPEIKALLCANDNMALGAVAALKAAGKQDSVIVIGFDNIQAVQDLIKQGKVLCTVDQHADQLAVYGIQYALDIINKKASPADKETPVDLITKDTLK